MLPFFTLFSVQCKLCKRSKGVFSALKHDVILLVILSKNCKKRHKGVRALGYFRRQNMAVF